jgi:N-acetylglucosamine-6-phosphate deacetylase
MLRLLFRLLGEERAVAVSDAVAAAGLPEGAHEINGQIFLRRNGACYMEDGVTLAGGACDLFAQFQTLLRFGIAERAALKACTINPARVIGAEKTIGSIAPGKQADLLLVSARWQLEGVLLGGVLQESAAESFHLLQPSD